MEEERKPLLGSVVVYHDPNGRAYYALVTAVWSDVCVNVVIVSDNPEERDSYGRQIKRQTSVVHKSSQSAHGKYWRWDNEEPNAVVAPVAV